MMKNKKRQKYKPQFWVKMQYGLFILLISLVVSVIATSISDSGATLDGLITIGNLSVTNASTFTGNVTTNNLSVNSFSNFTGNSTFGNIIVNLISTFIGNSTFNNLTVENTSIFNGNASFNNVTINNFSTHTGNATFNNITINAFSIFNGNATFDNFTINNRINYGVVEVRSPNGNIRLFKTSTNTDSARGQALINAVGNSSINDSIVIGPGFYNVTMSLNFLNGTTIKGIGMPLIYDSNLLTPLFNITKHNIPIECLRIRANTTAIGVHSAIRQNVTGLIIRNVETTPGNNVLSNGITFSELSGGGATSHNISLKVYDSSFIGAGGVGAGGYGIYINMVNGSFVQVFNTIAFGDTDGIWCGGAGGYCEIYGGNYTSTLDAITSGGAAINIYGAVTRGEQSDVFSDGGIINIYSVFARTDAITGNNVQYPGTFIVGKLAVYNNITILSTNGTLVNCLVNNTGKFNCA